MFALLLKPARLDEWLMHIPLGMLLRTLGMTLEYIPPMMP
jgi:hypothetical protein